MDDLEGMSNIPSTICPECGAAWVGVVTCELNFHQMLFWEHEYPEYGAQVHHLMVLCYHLQHPTLFSPRGLTFGLGMLVKFVREGASLEDVRLELHNLVDGGKRDWKFRGSENLSGTYHRPIVWSLTTAEIVRAGHENYCESVKAWAASILVDLQTAGYAFT